MENLYEQLGFKQPKILANPYGIKIYVGTKGNDDWCVVVPNWLVKLKHSSYKYDCDFALYLITEKQALETAKLYTELARQVKG